MFLYPFETYFIRTNIQRNLIQEKLQKITFLSDADFKKTADNPCVFYGEVSKFDFNLEHISKKQKGVNFIHGRILGADDEMYVECKLGAWQHQRVYFLLIALMLSILVFWINYLTKIPKPFQSLEEFYFQMGYGKSIIMHNINTPISYLLGIAFLSIFIVLLIKYRNFQKSKVESIELLRNLWMGQLINDKNVPRVLFR